MLCRRATASKARSCRSEGQSNGIGVGRLLRRRWSGSLSSHATIAKHYGPAQSSDWSCAPVHGTFAQVSSGARLGASAESILTGLAGSRSCRGRPGGSGPGTMKCRRSKTKSIRENHMRPHPRNPSVRCRRWGRDAAAAAACLAAVLALHRPRRRSPASNFPSKPVRILVPYGPGGVGDLTMRAARAKARRAHPAVVRDREPSGSRRQPVGEGRRSNPRPTATRSA